MSTDKLPPTPGPRCGEPAGHRRHRNRGEKPCTPCRLANQAAENKRRRDRRAGIPGPVRERWDYAGPKPKASELFIQEVTNLVEARQGWGRICQAFNTNPANLEARLMKNGRPDLADRIFGPFRYQITQKDAA
jgi:hypothetical protein